jgi:8-oxo-dGTP diphosphatase
VAGVVVGAAIISDGKVLTARRATPASLAGRWEFPGGKVETGESESQALTRELREELSLEVQVGDPVGRVPLGADRELVVYLCRVIGGHLRPTGDHDAVRWLTAAELPSVPWLDADALLLDAVRHALQIAASA